MSEEMSLLFSKLKCELDNQTKVITERVTENVLQSIEDKIKPLIEENNLLKCEVEKLNSKINMLQKNARRNNLLIHGVEESEKNTQELIANTKEMLGKIDLQLEFTDIDKIYRLGKVQDNGKTRPILLTTTTLLKKSEILKNKKKMSPSTYITEDFTREELEIRKNLQSQLKQERENGNLAYIRHNKIIVKGKQNEQEKRKRDESISPDGNSMLNPKQGTSGTKIHRANAFDYMRAKAYSMSEKNTYQRN